MDDERRKALSEAELQLTDAEATYGPLHPTVVALKTKIQALTQPSPELVAIREHRKELLQEMSDGVAEAVPQGRGSTRHDLAYRSLMALMSPRVLQPGLPLYSPSPQRERFSIKETMRGPRMRSRSSSTP